jgi:poly-gamma-glutamate synthesis protein (capsule biosynthesis protein)
MALVAAGTAQPDIVFSSVVGPGPGIVTRTFVPVTSWSSGVANVTTAELQLLAQGQTSFAALGGYGGEAVYAVVSSDMPVVGLLLAGSATPALFEDYAAMRAAMADVTQGPYVALAPRSEIGPGMSVLALDGVDPSLAAALPEWPLVERVVVEAASEGAEETVADIELLLAERAPAISRIVATGDILMVRCTLDRIRATGDWGAPFRGPVGGFLAGADLALGSLDSSIQDIGEPYGCVATTNLTAPAETIEALTVAGFDEVTIATNHTADCGDGFCGMDALTRTVEIVSEAGIKVVGGGANLEAALAPAIFTVNGMTIGVLGFDDIAADSIGATETGPGTAPLDDSYEDEHAEFPDSAAFYGRAETLGLERFSARIRALKEQVDLVVVQVQSGYEDTHDPSPRSVKALRAAVDAGADLVIGNQAHWAGAIEVRDGTFVAYALGNFVFDQLHTPEHSEGYLVEAILHDGRVATVRLHPYRIVDQYHPEFAETELRAKILSDVFAASERLTATWPD